MFLCGLVRFCWIRGLCFGAFFVERGSHSHTQRYLKHWVSNFLGFLFLVFEETDFKEAEQEWPMGFVLRDLALCLYGSRMLTVTESSGQWTVACEAGDFMKSVGGGLDLQGCDSCEGSPGERFECAACDGQL